MPKLIFHLYSLAFSLLQARITYGRLSFLKGAVNAI